MPANMLLFPDLHAFDLELQEWQEVSVTVDSDPSPSPRHSHAAVVYQRSIYIFGGYLFNIILIKKVAKTIYKHSIIMYRL